MPKKQHKFKLVFNSGILTTDGAYRVSLFGGYRPKTMEIEWEMNESFLAGYAEGCLWNAMREWAKLAFAGCDEDSDAASPIIVATYLCDSKPKPRGFDKWKNTFRFSGDDLVSLFPEYAPQLQSWKNS